MEDNADVVILLDEEGAEHEFQVIDFFDVDDQEYAVLLPVDETIGEEEGALILRVEEDEDEQILIEIEDDDEWDRAAVEWERRLSEDMIEEEE